MKFRKKPVVIEAIQYTGDNHVEGMCMTINCAYTPARDGDPDFPHVHTQEGPLRVSVGDWIITGVKGERYPCKPDVFEATYEAVEP